MNLATLYKKTNTGAIQYWKTWVREDEVYTEFGQINTDKPQTTMDVIEGKNKGKKNETTDREQALIKAKQNWDKQIKKGYVEDLDQAKRGENELEGIKPMLAQKFEDRQKEIKASFDKSGFIVTQRKLDGIRCICVVKDGKAKLYTRTQKEIKTVPHINKQVELFAQTVNKKDFILDGELYCHKFSDNFNDFISIVKRDELHENHTIIEYWVYDVPSASQDAFQRMSNVAKLEKHFTKLKLVSLKVVESDYVKSFEAIDENLSKYLLEGFEGLMVRLDGPYEFKRSKYLLKYKNFKDDEFKIIGIEEGNGKLRGHVGSFICETKEGKQFNCKLKGKLSDLKFHFENADKVIGKLLTVKYFELTPDGVPRFPVGISLRDYE